MINDLEGGVYITSAKQRVEETEVRHRISVEERVEKIGTRDKAGDEDTLDDLNLDHLTMHLTRPHPTD